MIAYCHNCDAKTEFLLELQSGAFCCRRCGRELSMPTLPERREAVVERFAKPPGGDPGCAGCHRMASINQRIEALEKSRRPSGIERIRARRAR